MKERKYTVDRIEDGIATLIDENGKIRNIRIKLLPQDTEETDCVNYSCGKYYLDEERKNKLQQEIKQLEQELFE